MAHRLSRTARGRAIRNVRVGARMTTTRRPQRGDVWGCAKACQGADGLTDYACFKACLKLPTKPAGVKRPSSIKG